MKNLIAIIAFLPVLANAHQVSPRAYVCEHYDFAELNSMEFDELESTYCSSSLGSKRAMDRFNKTQDDKNTLSGVNTTIYAGRAALAQSEKCMKIMSVAGDIQRRKFKDTKFDCSNYNIPDRK